MRNLQLKEHNDFQIAVSFYWDSIIVNVRYFKKLYMKILVHHSPNNVIVGFDGLFWIVELRFNIGWTYLYGQLA